MAADGTDAEAPIHLDFRMMHDEVSDTENIRKNLAIERMIVEGCDILLDTSQTFVRQGERPSSAVPSLRPTSFAHPRPWPPRLSDPAAVGQRARRSQQGPPGLPLAQEGRGAAVFPLHQTLPHLHSHIWRQASLTQGQPHGSTDTHPAKCDSLRGLIAFTNN